MNSVSIGDQMYGWARDLFPICPSLRMSVTRYSARRAAPCGKSTAPSGVMGVIIAVTIWPNGALVVVIPERYPQPGARSSRLTAQRREIPPGRKQSAMGSQVARSGPEKLLGLLDAFSHAPGSGRGRAVQRARARREHDQPCAQTPPQPVNRVPVQSASQR